MLNLLNYTIVTRRFERKLAAWAQKKDGSTAVEFALIATPFFFLIFGLLEISVLFIMSSAMENAIGEASREIRTGNFQKAGLSAARFKEDICEELLELLQCDDNLFVDVRRFDSFSSSNNPDPVNEEGEFESGQFRFDPGGPDEIIVVRIFYKWDLFTPVLSVPLKDLKDGEHLLRASIAFRNEPYGQPNGGGNTNTAP